MPDYHFTVKGHPVGFIIEAPDQNNAIKQYEELMVSGNSGIVGFTTQDIISIENVKEQRPFYMLGDIKVT
ncbi:MAG: hypothetical protein WC516_08145 [Patescibacteria group bacterium]|jgi:hypothetical protein